MKYLHPYLLAVVVLIPVVLFNACDLSGPPQNSLSESEIFENQQLIDIYLDDLYKAMGHGLYEIMLASLTDESHFVHGYGTFDVINLQVVPSYLAAWEGSGANRIDEYQWGELYSTIALINRFLENIDDSAIQDESLVRQMKGEVYFLRAYIYHKLLKAYGGVPVIERSFDLNEDLEVPRNTFAETVGFIVEETEKASEILPLHPRERGYATKGAAMALKSRVLLIAASDLYNENPVNEYVGYSSNDRQSRWEDARDAAREVIDLGIYDLYHQHSDPVENFRRLFLTNEDHEEAIMSRFFELNDSGSGDGYSPGLHNGPNGYWNWGGNTPVLALVNAFQMKDGTDFNWDNPEHAADPFANRDPRFYGTILYDGVKWRERPVGYNERDPQGVVQTFQELIIPTGDTLSGLDTRNSPIQEWNGSYTGFYLRKFIDPSNDPLNRRQEVPWRFFRYAEILLNYAEASFELGEENETRWAVNRIRERAGMPEIVAGGDDLLRQYRNERRIELAFEDHRYWDIRRWKIAHEVYHGADGVEIRVEATDPTDRETYFNYQYSGSNTPGPQEEDFYSGRRLDNEWSWDEKAYFLPIPHDELRRNESLVQNPGY